MANKELRVKIQDAYDTEVNWIANDPVLLAGQVAFSSDKYGKYKVGDGVKTWNQLEYITLSWNDITGKPSTFNPNQHNHTISQISDIGSASVKHASTAGSATNATTATKLGTATKGSVTQPVYLNAGVPTACTYTLGKSVPSNAVFTDTNTWIALKGATTTAAGTAGYAPAPTAGAANRYLRSDGTWAVPPDTNTTYTLGSFGVTATAQELNYVKGVTSNIQDQLSYKASIYHSHSGEYSSVNHTHTASQITNLPTIEAITDSEIDSLRYL